MIIVIVMPMGVVLIGVYKTYSATYGYYLART